MLTSMQGVDHEIAGIANGADEYLTRPLHPELVRTRVRAMLRNKAAVDSLEEAESILIALAQAVEKRDKYTGDHCDRLAYYSVLLGRAIGLGMPDLVALHRGGYLHDIGKIAVPDSVLFKPAALTAEEWEVMKSHTWKGEEICRPMKTLAKVLPIIRNHHEKWDGTGYPDGLKGEKIPLLARILQMADIYDALTTARPYKRAYTHEEAMAVFDEEVRKGWRDPELVSLFQQICPPVEEDPSGQGMGRFRESLDNLRRELFK
jgi:putative two-component system response regulator